jgi:hypothetical protein
MLVCARRSWRDPAGESPARVGSSVRPVASVAGSSATAAAKRTQRDDEDCIELRKRQSRGGRGAANRRRQHVRDRSARAPPESETRSSRQGSCRNLGDLLSPAAATAVPGRIGKLERATPVRKTGEGRIVPVKPRTTPAGRLVAESVEGRVEGRARANACPGHRAGTGMSPTACVHGPELEPKPRMRLTFDRSPVRTPKVQRSKKPHAGICAGGGR